MRWIRQHKLIASLISLLVILAIIFAVSISTGTGGNSVSAVVNSSNSGIAGFFANIGYNIKDGALGIFAGKSLQEKIKAGVNADNYDKPLAGLRIVVDAGNGAGGFYAERILKPLLKML